jgi:hypothetical protein
MRRAENSRKGEKVEGRIKKDETRPGKKDEGRRMN